MTALFYTSLHIIGILCLLPISKKIPAWFIASTGFVWGIFIWVTFSLISAFLGLPFSFWTVSLLLLPLIAAAFYFTIRKKTYQLKTKQWGMIGASILIIIGLSFLLTRSSYVYATTDSFNYIYHGKILARSGLAPWVINNFTKLGAFSSVVQMNSEILPGEYLSGYQTLLGISLIAVLFISMALRFKESFSTLLALVFSGALLLTLFSTTFLEHTFYIHNNLPAAIFLFLSVYSFWCYYQGQDPEWMFLGLAAIIGFSFTRIEGPLYSIAIIILVISIKPQSYLRTLLLVLPYTLITLSWHIFLLTNVVQNEQLSQTNLFLIISGLIGLALLALFSKWLSNFLPVFPSVLTIALTGSLILSVILEPDHMIQSITHFWQNLTNIYFWGWTWIGAAGIVTLSILQKKTPGDRLLLSTLSTIILIVLLLALARNPYRLGKTDSANRLMLQILPLIYFSVANYGGAIKEMISSNPE